MSARRSLSDASAASADDDEFLSAAFDELEAEASSSSAASSPPAAASRRGARRSNAARMLEALEALSLEADAEGAGVPQSLRGLLEQLQGDGSVLGGLFPLSQLLQGSTGNGARFQRLQAQLARDQAAPAQTAALAELCETLSLSSEEALAVAGFSVDAFVPAVAALIRAPSSMDALLLAARALSTMLELFPAAATQQAAAEHVIPALCEKLLEIEYMDVAELALQILERLVCKAEAALSSSSNTTTTTNAGSSNAPNVAQLCAQYRVELIQENGLVALLQFLDFFPLEIQRRAARIVCQLCTDFPLSMQDKLRAGLPYVTNLLRSFDNEILQSSFACLQKLGESTAFSENAGFASMVATEEICGLLVNKLTSYASVDGAAGSGASSQLSPTGYTSMLRFLSCLLSCVPSDMCASSVIASASYLRFVTLPPIVTALLAKQEVISENQLLRETLKLVIVVLPIAEELTSTDEIPPQMLALAHGILPLIIRVYDVTSRADLRYDCLGVIFRSCSLMHASQQPFTAQERTELSRLAAFLARVLRPKRNDSTATSVSALVKAEKDFVPVQLALRIIEVPLAHTGAEEAAKDIFERHGVADIIRVYASSSTEGDAVESDLQEIQTTSARLVREYFGYESSIVSVMAQLESLVGELQTTLTTTSTTKTDQPSPLLDALLQLRDFVVQGEDFLTAHEIASSGLVKVLIQILSTDQGQKDFTQMLEVQRAESKGSSFVTSLLRCLQDAISSEKDAFSVSATAVASADMGLSSGSVANDLDQLTQHIKVHVLIEETKPAAEPDNEDQSTQQVDASEEQGSEETPLRWMKKISSKRNGSSYKTNKNTVHDTVVLVEPLARIETMEDFIADKLFGRGGSGESILDELAGAGAEGEEEGEDESGEFANDVVKPRRVIATYKEHILPRDMSILEAIVKFGGVQADEKVNAEQSDSATGASSSSRSRIWTAAPHDITFRVAASSAEDAVGWESASEDSKIAAAFTAASDAEVSTIAGQWWDDVWDLLLLLKLPSSDVERKCEESDSKAKTPAGCTLKWWILSDEEVQYLAKVFPRHTKKVNHPVLQCAHCDTVNFPGTDAGIVVMDGDRMVSRSGRRMFERDYRAVTKHVSPLCEGTPLNVMTSAITRSDVDMLVENLTRSPEVLESEVESLNYLSEAALAGGNVGGGPPVTAPFGLYPKPYLSDHALDEAKSSGESSETSSLEADAASLSGDEVDVLTWFRFLGRFVGQAILDERLLNLPFARPFLRALRGETMVGSGVSVEKSLSFVEELDPAVANSLRYLHGVATKYVAAGDGAASADVAAWKEEVDSLCLSFTMVGADDIPLEAGGEDVSVTLDSLHRYVALNLEFLLERTIKSQVQAFRQGFEQICGGDRQLFRCLQAFEVRELEALLSDRGAGSTMWDRDGVDLREHMVCDHGYTADSRAIAHLVSILCELTVDEQRLFVRFVTGANRLPLGGLRSLEPKLTVVRKLTEAGDSEQNDAVLPSASTCTNYLKLPDYSTREIMKQRLLFCIHEGQCSFHLS
ncbi:HECT E3 ubiquitin ligase [Phytophthora cinnamomi]|uniref:HECT E3 ubiquitin ligase n=1 Tax=Phytophthora cinnamomi TaxID=4785 RepID=UPI00355A655E|nr:HECT E3 ubiquitin ligase [Phytophthora cinnamomi]